RLGRGHLFLRYAGADDVESVERGFGGDLLLEALEGKAALLDGECKVLSDFVLVDDLTDPHADLVAAGKRAVLDTCLDLLQFLLGGCEKRRAFVRAQFPQIDITARHQPFSGKVRLTDLKDWR